MTGRPKRFPEDHVATTVRISSDLLARLTAEAERRMIGRSLLVEHAIRTWLDTHEGEGP
jgi:predicted transcriptional regulator